MPVSSATSSRLSALLDKFSMPPLSTSSINIDSISFYNITVLFSCFLRLHYCSSAKIIKNCGLNLCHFCSKQTKFQLILFKFCEQSFYQLSFYLLFTIHTEAYLEPSYSSVIKIFCKIFNDLNKAFNYFNKKAKK